MKALGKEGALHGEFASAGQRAPDGSRKNSDGHRDHCARSAFGAGLSFAAGASPASLAHRRADEMSVQEMDNATFAAYVARENAIFTALDAEVTAKVTPQSARR